MEEAKEKSQTSTETETTMTRREFLRNSTLGIAAFGAALAFSGCSPKKVSETEPENDNLKKNIEELNKQYFLLEKEIGPFSYDRFKNQYPEFEQYIPFINTASENAQRSDNVNKNAMKLIISSIITANINNREIKDPNKDPYTQRTGPMQFYPIHSKIAIKERLNDSTAYSSKKLEDPFINILIGKECILYVLEKMENDGKNKDMFSLTLAGYYDQTFRLVNIVKNNLSIDNYNYLRSNYDLYQKTLTVLEGKESSDKSAEEILNKAAQYWPETKIENFKSVFINETDKYYNDENNINPKLSKAELAALFVAVAMTESDGGLLKVSSESGALGWYQLVPQWQHLENYNAEHGTNYTYDDIYNNDTISIKVGIWTLMRHRDSMDIQECLRFFKGGNTFGQNLDDGIWWNRVSYSTQRLLGRDALNMGYIDYFYNGYPMDKDYFLKNPEHIGNVLTS